MEHIFKKNLILDFLFIVIGYICMIFYNQYNYNHYYDLLHPILSLVATAATIIIIYLYPMKVKEGKHIYENKRTLTLFFILEVFIQIMIYTFNRVLGLNNSTAYIFNETYILLLQLGISSTIFISYFFKIRLKDFSWDINFKSFILIIIVYTVCIIIINIFSEIHINNIFSIQFILKFINRTIVESIYPGIYEEVLFRGFLISGLKGLDLSDNKCNIIQAIIFGISHVMGWGTASWIFLLSTASQAMTGYIIGKIYFKTKSLVPCIILHGLMDVVI